MIPVSVVINTLNEERQIQGCIESVRWADQIVVVDMMSSDNTAEIAGKLGCEVYAHKREGYVEPARQFAISKARHPWVLVIDADERCSTALATWIKTQLLGQQYSAFRIPRRNYMKDRWLKCCGWYPDSQLRLFRKDKATFSNIIHRAPLIRGEVKNMPVIGEIYLQNHAVTSLMDRFEKLVRYGQIAADNSVNQGKRVSGIGLFLRVAWSFGSSYLLKGGIMNGSLGLVLSLDRAMATLIKYSLIWEQSLSLSNPAKQSPEF
jgi:glycosyltransferase involved in cell wall biosynthesis